MHTLTSFSDCSSYAFVRLCFCALMLGAPIKGIAV
jgi:hypothetical protein